MEWVGTIVLYECKEGKLVRSVVVVVVGRPSSSLAGNNNKGICSSRASSFRHVHLCWMRCRGYLHRKGRESFSIVIWNIVMGGWSTLSRQEATGDEVESVSLSEGCCCCSDEWGRRHSWMIREVSWPLVQFIIIVTQGGSLFLLVYPGI